jgi:hypothetical protein
LDSTSVCCGVMSPLIPTSFRKNWSNSLASHDCHSQYLTIPLMTVARARGPEALSQSADSRFVEFATSRRMFLKAAQLPTPLNPSLKQTVGATVPSAARGVCLIVAAARCLAFRCPDAMD